jgi:glutathione peroxidase
MKIKNIYEFSINLSNGEKIELHNLKNKVLLLVNTASKCGFTPQYKELEELYQKFKNQGFLIIGFPCNQFGSQEPGTESEIKQFCELNYGVTFPLSKKIDVNGANTDPLFQYLKSDLPGVLGTEAIKWNFTKFLIGKEGIPKKRYAPTEKPLSLLKDIETELNKD